MAEQELKSKSGYPDPQTAQEWLSMVREVRGYTRKEIGRRLGVSRQSVSNRIQVGTFPAHWRAVLINISAECGICCGDHLFDLLKDRGPR